jgi:hypothetical protein
MLWTIIVILLTLWLSGLARPAGGPVVRALLMIAVIVLLVGVIRGRREA